MSCRLCIIAILLALPSIASAQEIRQNKPSQAKVKTGKVPELLYAQFPSLQSGAGVVVLEAPPLSLARALGLQRYDIVVSCDGNLVKDQKQLDVLLASDSRNAAIPVVIMRRGRLHTFQIVPSETVRKLDESAKSVNKPGAPPPLRVTAEPLAGGRFKVNLQYYVGSGKMVRVEQTGTLAEIGRQVKELNADARMPAHIYDLASTVLEHIRQSTTARKSQR